MSDRDLSYSPPPLGTTSKKRKSTGASTGTRAKRTKSQLVDPFAGAKDAIHNALASPNSFTVPTDESGTRSLVLMIAQYAKSLEGSVAVAGTSGQPGPPPKTADQIASEAERIAGTINKGVKKQMSWKPTCKENRATYAFDGVCADPRVFGAVLKLDGPPTFKAKKFPVDDFQGMVGRISSSARYSHLSIKGEVNVRYNEETGEFKISGKYGAGY